MSDSGGGGLGKFVSEVGAAVVAPIGDEFQKAAEVAAQSLTGQGTPLTDPQAEAKRQQEEAARNQKENQKKAALHQWFQQLQTQEQQFYAFKQKKEQEKNIKLQEEQQKKQEKQEKKYVQQEREAQLNESTRKGKNEIKGGVGG